MDGCIDVLCEKCGRRWCCRCGKEYSTLDAEAREARVKMRAGYGRTTEVRMTGMRCECGETDSVVLE